MEVHGGPWRSMEVHGSPWIAMDIHGSLWTFRDVRLFSLIFIDFRKFSLIFHRFHKFSLIFIVFLLCSYIFVDFQRFSCRCAKWLKSRKQHFAIFWLFTPLYRRLRLSRVSQTVDLDEIYRLVSKILHFTPCGSVFRSVLHCMEEYRRIVIENLFKIYLKSV